MGQIKLTFSGDIMLNNDIINNYYSKEMGYDFSSMFEDIKYFLGESNIAVGNLETPISNKKEDIKINQQYRFTSPMEFSRDVKKAGFDFVSTANNHCLDNGINGIEKTINCLNHVGLKHTGVFCNKKKVDLMNIDNIKIAIL